MPTAWRTLASMSLGLGNRRGCTIGDYFYVCGGDSGGIYQTDHSRYDPTANTWSSRTGHPNADGIGAGGYRSVAGKGYYFGGLYRVSGEAYASTQCHEYDPAANTWAVKASMTLGRLGFGYAADASNIYIAAGQGDPSFGANNTLERFTPSSNTWTILNSAVPIHDTNRRENPAGAVLSGKFYLSGGRAAAANVSLAKVDVYDLTAGTWSAAADMPVARTQHSMWPAQGKLWVAGGGASEALHSYDPSTNTWSIELTDMDQGGINRTSLSNSAHDLLPTSGDLVMAGSGTTEVYAASLIATGGWQVGN